jgi:hypothetical protein
MKYFSFKTISALISSVGLLALLYSCSSEPKDQLLKSKDGLNEISLNLNENGELFYKVKRKGNLVVEKSPLGLRSDDQDFTRALKITKVSPVTEQREKYTLKVGNQKLIDHVFNSQSITFSNNSGALMVVDLMAGKEGVAFRYRFPESREKERVIEEEITGFQIQENAKGWLQPYNKAGQYTPAYEDFYFNVSPGDTIANPRNPSVGWCMPALFNVNNKKNWILIAESGTDGSYCGCHLKPDSEGGMYKVAFAKMDETFTLPIDKNTKAKPKFKLPWTMPWRVIIIGDNAGDILLSSLITDLAPASKIEDTSWIESGKASWSWWSHNDDNSAKIYNEFTNLAVLFDWEYTLFDAGWEEANKEGDIVHTAASKGVKPLVWGYSGNFFHPDERKKRLKELADMGVRGVKIDFWCSDRQEAMAAIQSLFEDAANEHLLVNLHGATVPRGWQRTWPNFVSAEAVLGTESYFYDERFPDKAAEQNTVLPFTRNVAGPTDYTPFALTIRKYPRVNTAVHELATSMIYTSGIIHFADSKEVFESLPDEIKNLLQEMPATWDETKSLIAEPGKAIVLSREKDALSYIVGINGTNNELPIELDLSQYKDRFSNFRLITEGKDPLMEFATNTNQTISDWSYTIAPKGGFIIQFIN